MSGRASLLLALACAVACARPGEWSALDGPPGQSGFESGTLDGWSVVGDGYTLALDDAVAASGRASALLQRASTATGAAASGQATACRPAAGSAGRTVRYRARVQTAGVSGWAALWLRADGRDDAGDRKVLAYDNMNERPIRGDNDWDVHGIVVDVPGGSVTLCFGALLNGPGSVWLDDMTLEVR